MSFSHPSSLRRTSYYYASRLSPASGGMDIFEQPLANHFSNNLFYLRITYLTFFHSRVNDFPQPGQKKGPALLWEQALVLSYLLF
jgi:hypothetical protein